MESNNKDIFAKNLQYYMNINNKTRRDMCEALDISYYTFSDWVNAKKYPRMDKIELLANYFGILKSDLIEDKSNKDVVSDDWQPHLTAKDERDIARQLEKTLADLESSQNGLMFSGEPLDDETRELLKISLENSIRVAKIAAKKKYTPKKYRK